MKPHDIGPLRPYVLNNRLNAESTDERILADEVPCGVYRAKTLCINVT